MWLQSGANRFHVGREHYIMVACAGPLATIGCEPRQARKGAAAAADSCAGVWLVQVASILKLELERLTRINELSGFST